MRVKVPALTGAPTGTTKLTRAYMIHGFFELDFKNTAKNTVIIKTDKIDIEAKIRIIALTILSDNVFFFACITKPRFLCN